MVEDVVCERCDGWFAPFAATVCPACASDRAARRCSDCVHFGAYVEVGGSWNATCLAWHWNGDRDENREPAEILRTAASCDDYEEVRESEEGVAG